MSFDALLIIIDLIIVAALGLLFVKIIRVHKDTRKMQKDLTALQDDVIAASAVLTQRRQKLIEESEHG